MAEAAVKDRAIQILRYREHSAWGLSCKLQQRGFAQDQILEVIAALQEEGLQSDQRYAEAYVRYRSQRGFGPYYVQQMLQAEKISETWITRAIEEQDIDWKAVASKVVQKVKTKSTIAIKKHLQQRGFSTSYWSIIEETSELTGEMHAQDE
jgi:regulatory protein